MFSDSPPGIPAAIQDHPLWSRWAIESKQFPGELELCRGRLLSFVQTYGVKEYRDTCKSLHVLFAQGGSGNGPVREFLKSCFRAGYGGSIGDRYGRGNAFDHIELWGRDRIPLFLVGHPYQIKDDAIDTLAAIQGLGLSVQVHGGSWYGFGTAHVRAYHGPTVERVSGQGSLAGIPTAWTPPVWAKGDPAAITSNQRRIANLSAALEREGPWRADPSRLLARLATERRLESLFKCIH